MLNTEVIHTRIMLSTKSSGHHDKETIETWEKHAEDNEKTTLKAKLREELHPTRSASTHGLFRMVGLITTIAAILMAIGQFMGAFVDEDLGHIDSVLRGYIFCFASWSS
jgi:hypothetical protein